MKNKYNKPNNLIKNTICSLYEVENFLDCYNSFQDALSIIKIIKKHKYTK